MVVVVVEDFVVDEDSVCVAVVTFSIVVVSVSFPSSCPLEIPKKTTTTTMRQRRNFDMSVYPATSSRSAFDAELVKVPDDDADLEVDLSGGDGGEAVAVGRRAHQVGVSQLVPAADVVLGERVAKASRRRPPGDGIQGCQMAKFDPFRSLDCARVEGMGAQSKERKGSHFAA